jgi:anaerobic C4-dicarboxylate transporter DcuA
MGLWFQLAILMAAIVLGARRGGMALGPMGGLGLFVFVFLFGLPPGSPPGTVLGMILAVITALSLLEAAGGLDLVVRFAERILRGNPRWITVLAPLVTYALVFASGTQHVIYALLPVIAEVSRKAGVRPERPLSMSVIASQQGLIASPVSAVTAALVVTLAGGPALPQILLVVIPATLVGLAAGTLSVAFRGVALADDPEYKRRLAEGKVQDAGEKAALDASQRRPAVVACAVFVAAIAAVVLIGIFPGIRPIYEQTKEGITETGQVEMGRATMIVMLAAAGLLLLFAMGSSFFEGNRTAIVGAISATVETHPWVFAAGLFVLSLLLFSQAAAVAILGPVAIAIGLPAPLILGAYPAVNGNFFLPTYGTVLAAVSFDQTGTTRIGRYLLNHSFMRPGLVATVTSTVAALGLARWIL